ncbi:restriction endonuclease subunit S [Microbacterium sp. SCN 69-37]|uniref:restriction endonuclease subunit S n=1 Tax=Microbacterium sp. SCN 69-37 TaxID=1660115 RepID=UPI00086D7443|nr:restriction endonuclease subunit S [Microbacterium sp. SCN 69-37]ODT23721.1 MAG: hypothetical protein ABS64_09345 [Microbacterium sp. SCN 69-37]
MQGPWSDGVPTGWQIRPLWSEFRRGKTLGDGSEELLSVYRDYGVIPKSSREDNFNKPSEDLSKYQRVSVGDLVVNKMKAWQGSLGISNHDGIVSPAYFVYKATGTFEPRFAHYLLRSKEYADHMAAISSGIRPNQWDLDPAQFAVTPLLVPPPAEQRAIADYLDRETTQIDAFIAKNEELITLLTERRASVIGAAVTRGLDERVELSVESPDWIGPVPAAWSVQPIKSAYSVVVGKMLNESKSEGDPVPYVRAANIQPDGLDLSDVKEMKATAADRRALSLRSGDVVFVEGGGGYGRSDYLTQDLPGWVFQNHVIRLRSRPGHDGRFLNYWLQHVRRLGHYEALSAFATIPNVSGDKLGRIEMPAPPLWEQREIVKHIEEACSRIDAAVAVAQRSVELARERRAALISAAVTGKIDVGVAA